MEADSRLCHRSNGLLGIILTITDPSQAKFITVDENFANGLQGLRFAVYLKQHIGAPAECAQSPVKAVQALCYKLIFFVWHNSSEG
jgi:hypothetical protein